MSNPLPPSAQKVQDALIALGLPLEVVTPAQSTRSAPEAAQALGCAVEQIVKSLVFRGKKSHRPILVLASGANRVNEKRLAELVAEPVERADPEFVRRHSGFAIGGVPPVGHPEPLETFIDEDLLRCTEIWAAAGTPNSLFKLPSSDLVVLTKGQVVTIT
jgi:prolyl-tRNA editing enzyme YbaK/EbsC (Cys-tRNA(Pro) deacylase)